MMTIVRRLPPVGELSSLRSAIDPLFEDGDARPAVEPEPSNAGA